MLEIFPPSLNIKHITQSLLSKRCVIRFILSDNGNVLIHISDKGDSGSGRSVPLSPLLLPRAGWSRILCYQLSLKLKIEVLIISVGRNVAERTTQVFWAFS